MGNNVIKPVSVGRAERNSVYKNSNVNDQSFKNMFESEVKKNNEIVFSRHAADRISQRNISLSSSEIKDINDALEVSKTKGVKDSVIIMNDLVLIANVASKTIVTLGNKEDFKQKVFTNIDGAVCI